ncbi:MAG: FecR domain-containing protein, partial [Leptospiraceae bacterium]|nr:FecR domain-containing protein [Leptospiraceae bacterium]
MHLLPGFALRPLHCLSLLLVSSLLFTSSSCISIGHQQPDSEATERSAIESKEKQANAQCENRCLSGDCSNGTGEYEFRDCSVYEGEFQQGRRNGKGLYRFPSGANLSGIFQDGRPTGPFEYRFPEGGVFKGELQRNDVVASNGGFQIEGATGTLIEDGRSRQCVVQDLRLLCESVQTDQKSAEKQARPKPDAPEVKAEEIRFLILYAPQSAVLLRDGKSFAVSSGYPLVPGDSITTGEHSADIQGEGGFAIRLRPYSELYVPPEASEDRVLILRKGSVMVDYDGEGPLPFRIRSGGMNIDVKGTTF